MFVRTMLFLICVDLTFLTVGLFVLTKYVRFVIQLLRMPQNPARIERMVSVPIVNFVVAKVAIHFALRYITKKMR